MSEKKKILLRVHRKLQEPYVSHADYITKAMHYTGLHPSTLKKLDNSEKIKLEFNDVDRNQIYNTLCSFYVRYRGDGGKLPTTYELFDALVKINKLVHMDIGDFRKLLIKMGFIWQKVGSQYAPTNAVVIEDPLVRFQRYCYLMKIRRSRVERYDDIYFVGEVAYNEEVLMNSQESLKFDKSSNGAFSQQRVIYAVGVKAVTCFREVKEFTKAAIENWIITDLCSSLSIPSVIVVPDNDHYKAKLLETPTLYSTKLEVSHWLDFHNIPYDSGMSKYELYSLAEEYTDLETPLYKIDGILKARGHTLLRLPDCVEKLSPAAMVYQTIKNNWDESRVYLVELNKKRDTTVAKSVFEDIVLTAAKHLDIITNFVIADEQKASILEKDVDIKLERLTNQSNSFVLSSEGNDSDTAFYSDSE